MIPESITPTCLAVVVQHLVEMPELIGSGEWPSDGLILEAKKIPGNVGIDTRQVAEIVLEYGRVKVSCH